MLQCNHKERSSYPLRCNMRSPCVIPSSRKIHRFFLRNFYPAACLCFCQVLKRLPYAVRSFLHFFSKQSFRMLLVHRVLLVFVVLPAAISVFLASVLCVRYLFRFPCHIINHIRLYIKAIGNLYLRQRRTNSKLSFWAGRGFIQKRLSQPPRHPTKGSRIGAQMRNPFALPPTRYISDMTNHYSEREF